MSSATFTSSVEPDLHDAVVVLHETLLAERAALQAQDADALSTLCQRKRLQVLDLERALRPSRLPATTLSGATRDLLRACQELNTDNAAGVAVRLAGTRRALGQLARLSGADQAWGYSADGAPSRPLRGRRLGEG